MKKLIKFIVLALVIYSCQQAPAPAPAPAPTINSLPCGTLGDCMTGAYLFDSVKTMDPTVNQTGTDTIVTGLVVQLLYNGDSISNGITNIKYRLDASTCNLPFISPACINNWNHFMWRKNEYYGNGIFLITKTNKTMAFWRI